MRTMALVLAAVVLGGCPPGDPGPGGPDMAAGPPDLTTSPDLTVPPPDLAGADLSSPAAGATYTGKLQPAQEVPKVAEADTGMVTAVVNGAGDQVDITATFALAQATFSAAHVHKAAAGTNGSPVKDLPAPVAGTITLAWKTSDGTQPLTAALLNDLDSGALYVNIHTSARPNGHMRAQLVRMGETLYIARLTPGAEVPPVGNAGNAAGGVGYFFNPTTMKMRHYGEYSSLTGNPSAAHIHKAAVGVNGAPVYTIPGLPAATSGFFKGEADLSAITGTTITDFDNGGLYVNIHTTLNGNGEIRGQISEKY